MKPIEFDFTEAVGIFFVGLLLIVVSFIAGREGGRRVTKQEAVAAGHACWTINQETGQVGFEWNPKTP